VAIDLVDDLLRRGRYDSASLMDTAKGLYYRKGGVHWSGAVAQFIGMLAAASFLNAYPAWTSPLTRATNGGDASVFMGALCGGAIYFWLARPAVREEAERSPVGDLETGRSTLSRADLIAPCPKSTESRCVAQTPNG